jgi:hypothetical protein
VNRFDPIVLPRLALLISVLAVLSTTSADPDLWGHVRFGDDIIAAGEIPEYDSYSFTSDRPWVNHEWLAEVLFSAPMPLAARPG